jgi:hypothetical protein
MPLLLSGCSGWYFFAVAVKNKKAGMFEKFWLMIPLIEVLFLACFFCYFFPERDPGIESVETWLH